MTDEEKKQLEELKHIWQRQQRIGRILLNYADAPILVLSGDVEEFHYTNSEGKEMIARQHKGLNLVTNETTTVPIDATVIGNLFDLVNRRMTAMEYVKNWKRRFP
jgi:hypothetical protein